MEEVISTIINSVISSFDFTFCIIVNIATYLIIKAIITTDKFFTSTWFKRVVFLIVCTIISLVYYVTGSDIKIIVNSFILAPISWSWIFKPICNKLNIDYKIKDNNETNV